MSSSLDEFEAKLGQLIYTQVMYERLKGYLLDKAGSKGTFSLRIDLGKDKEGNNVYLDVSISKTPPGTEDKKIGAGSIRRYVVLAMVNEGLTGEDTNMAQELERIIRESLKWWHGYFRERDKLALNEWRTAKAIAADCVDVKPIFKIPIDNISVPPSSLVSFGEEKADLLAKIADILGPIYVRQTKPGLYELVAGLPKLIGYMRLGRDHIDAYIVGTTMQEGADYLSIDEAVMRLLEYVK